MVMNPMVPSVKEITWNAQLWVCVSLVNKTIAFDPQDSDNTQEMLLGVNRSLLRFPSQLSLRWIDHAWCWSFEGKSQKNNKALKTRTHGELWTVFVGLPPKTVYKSQSLETPEHSKSVRPVVSGITTDGDCPSPGMLLLNVCFCAWQNVNPGGTHIAPCFLVTSTLIFSHPWSYLLISWNLARL